MDWGYELLPDREQVLFRRPAVFSGGWTLEEAQAVCSNDGIDPDEVLDLLMHLVDKSLVIMQERDGEARCHMLETIREYAHKKYPQLKETNIALSHLAIVALLQDDYEKAAVLCTETLSIGRERGDNRTIAIALTILGFALWGKGELDQATFEAKWAEGRALTLQQAIEYALGSLAN